MTKQTPFQKFEALAQQLVEGTFQRFFGTHIALPDITAALAKAVEDQSVAGQRPLQYNVFLNPADFDEVRQEEPDVAAQLTDYLAELLQKASRPTNGQPHITLLADPAIPLHSVRVKAQVDERPSPQVETQIRQVPDVADELAADIVAMDAYLIIDGKQHIPLNKPIIAIGRSVENDIVLDAPSVSRKHAQIRWRYGRFILYDLSNRGRTLVNSQPVTETMLQSGDVISLSSVKLIYGVGETEQRPRPRPAVLPNDETQIRPPTQ